MQQEIIAALGVPAEFDAAAEAERRVAFLSDYLRSSGAAGFVLGISGGVDSSTAGRLAQLAVERVRADGGQARFIAVRLPYRVQHDEADAQTALDFVNADEVLTVDVAPATDALGASVEQAGLTFADDAQRGYHLGNVKARARMVAQYLIAGARSMLVLGTDHAAEAVVGFFTKHGDGACDVVPLAGLTKRRVRALAAHLGAPEALVGKVPTADLEDGLPGHPDELALGVSYDQIDTYLEGGQIEDEAKQTIESWYRRTAHKRELPAGPVAGLTSV